MWGQSPGVGSQSVPRAPSLTAGDRSCTWDQQCANSRRKVPSAGSAQLLGQEGEDAWHVAGSPQGLGLACSLGYGPESQFPCWMSANICTQVEQGVEIHLSPWAMRGCRVGVSQSFGVQGGLHVGTPTHDDRVLCVGG